jgi:ABC-2 type transport system permease protein
MGKSMLDQAGGDPTADLSQEQKDEAAKTISWMASLSPQEARQLGAGIKAEDYELVEIPTDQAEPEAWLREQLSADPPKLFAYFVIGEDPVASSDGFRYVSNNRTDPSLKDWVSSLATDEVQARRMRDAKIAPTLMHKLTERVSFSEKLVTAEGEEKTVEAQDTVRQWAPVAFVYLLWIAVITIAQMLLTNTVEEKSNRIIEVLLSSVSPLQLMGGKILGIAATGLTVVVSWVISFLVVLKFMPQMMGVSDLPVDLSVLISDPIFLVSFVVYFLLGYLLYAAILVGFGSVTNSLKEAQNLMQPVFVILIVPILAMVPIGQDPNGPLAKWLSYFPPFTPFVMMNRAAGPPSLMEYVATTALLVLSIVVAFWVAAKVFRIGILMTGKPPRLLEILHWIRTPVGVVPDTRAPAEAVAAAEDGRTFEGD